MIVAMMAIDQAGEHRAGDVGPAPDVEVVLEGEALPGDVLAARGIVEAEDDHHRDGQEQEEHDQRGEDRQQPSADERPADRGALIGRSAAPRADARGA